MIAELETMIKEMPLPTEAERKRDALIFRLACVLEDMSETLPEDHPVRREAIRWKDRENLEQLLDAWEAGRYAALRATG
ncbi:MAG: hypothetical protein U0359_37745 [Byssovorax sp.]